MKLQHSDYMELALKEARLALELGEIPVGCLIVRDGVILGRGHNTRETERTALGHAELNAIRQACDALQSWRLEGCTLYVTLEPCPMCMGALINARVCQVVFGAYDLKAGCCGSLADFNQMGFNHRLEILGGIRELECSQILSGFFERLRKKEQEFAEKA